MAEEVDRVFPLSATSRTQDTQPQITQLVFKCFASTAVHQFSAVGHSHRAKNRRHKDEPLYNSHRKPALQLLKRCDSTHYDDEE